MCVRPCLNALVAQLGTHELGEASRHKFCTVRGFLRPLAVIVRTATVVFRGLANHLGIRAQVETESRT